RDAEGRAISRTGPGGTETFGPDSFERMAGFTGGVSATYRLPEAGGQRAGLGASGYVWDGENVLQAADQSTTTQLLTGPDYDEVYGFVRAGVPYVALTDHLGSVVQVLDASGNVTHRYSYTAYGEMLDAPVEAWPNAFRYAGREQDAG